MRWYAICPLAVTRSDHYTYATEEPLAAGAVVSIPLAGRSVLGVVLGADQPFGRAKQAQLTGVRLTAKQLSLARWLAKEYLAPLGLCLKSMVFEAVVKYRPESAAKPDAGRRQSDRPQVLTQPGRWDRYRSAADVALKAGQSAAVLLPEVALTPAAGRRLGGPDVVVPYHSRLTPKQRAAIWWRVASGEPIVVVGSRAALFLPWHNLGYLAVDDEDDLSYKNVQTPTYHARSVAARLAQLSGADLDYGSAAPSLELLQQVTRGRMAIESSVMPPDYRVIDLSRQRRSDGPLGFELSTALDQVGAQGQRALVYAPDRLQPVVTAALRASFGRRVVRFAPERQRPDEVDAIWADYRAGRSSVVVGGQALARDWGVEAELVAVVGIDRLLQLSDFRATEKARGLLLKLGSRLTRDGRLLIETTEPEHPALISLGDQAGFVDRELAERRALCLPPARRLSRIVVTGASEAAARRQAEGVALRLATDSLKISTSACPIAQGGGHWRWQVLIKGDPQLWRDRLDRRWTIDIDPLSLR